MPTARHRLEPDLYTCHVPIRVFGVLLVVAIWVFTIVHVVQSNSERIRGMPKALWFVIVVAVPVAGVLAWWIFGRPLAEPPQPPTAPDDDPDFLRGL